MNNNAFSPEVNAPSFDKHMTNLDGNCGTWTSVHERNISNRDGLETASETPDAEESEDDEDDEFDEDEDEDDEDDGGEEEEEESA